MSHEKFIYHEEKIKLLRLERLNSSLISACEDGDLETVKIVLTSENLDLHADVLGHVGSVINYNLKFPLSAACKEGHLEIVKYLLTSPDLKQHADVEQFQYYAVFEACTYGHLDIIKYFFTSPDLKEQIDINIVNDGSTLLNEAACRGRVELVKFLLESPELKEHSNIHEHHDFAFTVALNYNTEQHRELIKYLIFDFNIAKTDDIKKHLEENPNKEVEKWFEARELNKSLEKELLSDKIDKSKKNKI